MNILAIEAKNFLSYEHFTYVFKAKSILIQGVNKTDENQESNGTGKTGFQAAIEYLLYGNTSQKVRDKDLVRMGQREAYLQLELNCKLRNEHLIIKRRIKRSGSAILDIYNNEKKVSIATILDGNRFISEWIGISKEDLQNYYIINNRRYKSFFNASNTDKIQIISRFSNANLIDGIMPIINKSVIGIENVIQKNKIERSKLCGIVETLQNSLDASDYDSFIDRKNQALEKINVRIKSQNERKNNLYEDIVKNEIYLKDYESQIDGIVEQIKITQKHLSSIDLNQYKIKIEDAELDFNQLTNSKREIDDKKRTRKKDLDDLEIILSKIQKNLLDAVICPQCHYEFLPGDSSVNVEDEKEQKAKIEIVIGVVKTKLDLINNKLAEIGIKREKSLSQKAEYEELQSKLNSTVLKIRESIDNFEYELNQKKHKRNTAIINIEDANKNIKLLNEQVVIAKEEYKQIEESKFDNELAKNYRTKLVAKQKLIESCDQKLIEYEQELSDIKNWSYNFKAFKSYLANQFLRVIEGLTNQFLEKLKSDIQIKWEGYKVKADESFSEKITPYVIRQGEMREFASFSGGERARMEFSLILTIRELINQSHPHGGLDFMFADEIFEGLDGIGLSLMMQTINQFNYPILVTTHVTDTNLYSDIMTIVKENGISRIDV